jgi:glycosyltransferase involved in cell wall biosynthesis
LNKKSIIVAYPKENVKNIINTNKEENIIFFYPSFPRVFKNFEIICEAAILLINQGITNFKISLTILGNENKYARNLFNKYHAIKNINFIGNLTNEEMKIYYEISTCLIFPSKLETWGLPISEYIPYNKPMIVADLPYAHETASTGENVAFFNINSAKELSKLMHCVINDDYTLFNKCLPIEIKFPYTQSWAEVFELLLTGENRFS